MRARAAAVRVVVSLAIPLLGLGPAMAGKAETDGHPPTSGSSAGSGWNPTFTCTTEPGDTLDDLFECLADGIESQPGSPCPPVVEESSPPLGGSGPPRDLELDPPGPDDCSDPYDRRDFVVTRLPWPKYGIQILRLDDSEIDRLYFWENDPAIQWTAVEVNRPSLVARIRNFTENPSRPGGMIIVTLDGIPVSVDTSRFRKAADLTQELLRQLRLAGFEAGTLGPDHIAVVRDVATGIGITRLEFQSGDPAIHRSDLALVPLEEVIDHPEFQLLPH